MRKLGFMIACWNKKNPHNVKYLSKPRNRGQNTPEWVWSPHYTSANIFMKKGHCIDLINELDTDNLGGMLVDDEHEIGVNKITYRVYPIVMLDQVHKATKLYRENEKDNCNLFINEKSEVFVKLCDIKDMDKIFGN